MILWCQVALHPVFENCGDRNKGALGRRLILCSIKSGATDIGKSTFQSLPPVVQDDPMTRYLMFKMSLACSDCELGADCIQHLSRCSDDRSQDILYACIRDAQQAGDIFCALAAVQAVGARCDSGKSPGIHFPSILRCTVRLMHMIENKSGRQISSDRSFVEDTCRVFEQGSFYVSLRRTS